VQRVTADAAIVVENLRYVYPGELGALFGVSFRAAQGECLGLVGPNGAGKTTLFLCLAGVLPTAAGCIRVAGLDPATPAERRRLPAKLGIVFQNSDDQLLQPSVLDDVAFGPLNLGCDPNEARQRAAEALAIVGAVGLEGRSPQHLAGGEKRRVALAGVLAMRPEVLLLDEPTMFLDPRGRREFIRLLPRLPGTRVLASHDLEMILETCSRAIVLDRGLVAADGPPRELFLNEKLMENHGLEVPYSLRS
jgi:cobalt/nickel transport system ATP-binding protein